MSALGPGPGGPPGGLPPGLGQLLAGGGGPGGPGAGGPPSGGGPPPGMPGGSAEDLVNQAKILVQKASLIEKDPEEQQELHTILLGMAKYLAGEQALKDQAMGAGPGAKIIRKAVGRNQ